MRSIDVLMTSHNRRVKTLDCLASVSAQSLEADVRVVLVDAGSTDGTREQVATRYPAVEVVEVGSDVYWGQGMQIAGRHARPDADYHLWLNDDVVLDPTALSELVRWGRRDRIVVGKLKDHEGKPTYGGLMRGRLARMSIRTIPVSSSPVPVDTMNGNVVLVGRVVRDALGPVRGDLFPHAFGDVDYGLSAGRMGFEVVQAPGTLGECSRNQPSPSRSLPSLRERLRAIAATKELPPRMWWHACRRNGGVLAPAYFMLPYVKLLRRRPAS